MQRSVTAIYRTHATASLVRDELKGLGIGAGHIEVIPDTDTGTAGTATSGQAGAPAGSTGPMGTGAGTAAGTGVPATGTAGMGTAGTGSAGMGADHDRHVDRIHDLGLPDDDTRTYQQAVRNGDHVVCVHLDDADLLTRVQEVMRRPEDAYNLAELDDAYAHAPYEPRRTDAERGHTPGMTGTRDVDQGHPRLRSYSRQDPIAPRRSGGAI